MSTKEEKLKEKLKDDPGNPIFAEFAEFLRRKERTYEALEVCLDGLTHNTGCWHGRLVLSRIYYDHGWLPFALKELSLIHEHFPENDTVIKLMQAIDPSFVPLSHDKSEGEVEEASRSTETVIAETFFDMGDLDTLDE